MTDLMLFRAEIIRLMKEVRQNARDPGHPYTKGYLDACVYLIDWIDELA